MTPSRLRSSVPVVGLSVGAATLAAVTADRAVTGRPVVTRAGCPIDGFTDRVGDPVGILAADGTTHSAAGLLAEALHGLARTAAAGRPVPAAVAVAYPGQWPTSSVEALRRALRRLQPWSTESARLTLLPDYVAALTALRSDPASGLPARGVVAVCDVGASATTVTLVDATDGFRAIGPPLHYPDFSGDAVDRALLTHVLATAGTPPGGTGTSAIAPLTRLRAECTAAKERLSAQTATAVPGRGAGLRGDIRVTRAEFDELIATPLAAIPGEIRNMLARNAIALTDLVAVVSVGGGAAIPAVTTTLSRDLRVPVITRLNPGLAAATGAALIAAGRTAEKPVQTVVTPVERAPEPAPVAWSQAADVPDLVPLKVKTAPPVPARPQLDFAAAPQRPSPAPIPWHRRPLVVAAAVLMVIAGAGGATALALKAGDSATPAAPPSVGVPPPPPVAPSPDEPPRTVVAVPEPDTPAEPPAPAVVEAPPVNEAPPVEPPPVSEAPSAPITDAATAAPAPTPLLPTIPPIPLPSIPALPEIPGLAQWLPTPAQQ